MIGRLQGELVEVLAGTALIECGGVGYEVLVPESVLAQLPLPGESVTLIIRHVFREDGQSLYGFLSTFQRRLFDLLTEVKGCGPKIGLSLIGQLGEDAVATGIQAQDPKLLARASGVGPRLAERIILELRDKINQELVLQKLGGERRAVVHAPNDSEVVEALLALGYRRQEAEAAATSVAEGAAVQDQIREALRSLRK